MSTTAATVQVPPLPISETCDRCPAPALVTVAFADDNVLVFCGHHFDGLPETVKATAGVNDILLQQLRG